MRGKNPIRPPEKGDGQMLQVKHIFPTLQGEGPFSGYPSVFLRLGGCNLACDFCDTNFEDFTDMRLEEIVQRIQSLATDGSQKRIRHLVVITGGEPFRQPIETLCNALIVDGFQIQIETNGTLYRALPDAVDIICSPKNSGQGYLPTREDLLARVTAFKYIVSASHPLYQQIGTDQGKPIYIQPMDEYDAKKNADNLKYATELAMTSGYRLSLQMHKIAGIE